MVEKFGKENLHEKKELLEKQLQELNALKANILKSKEKSDKKGELLKLNQEISEIEKKLLMIKLQELKALKDEIVLSENSGEKKTEQLNPKLSNFDNLLNVLESKIDSLNADNEKIFEQQKKEIEKNFEELQSEISEVRKAGKQVLGNLEKEVLTQQVNEVLPGHKNNEKRGQAILELEEDMKEKKGENVVANRAAKMFQKIMGNEDNA